MSIFSIFQRKQRVVDVDNWTPEYATVEDLARSSLVNLNTSSKETWTKDKIFLPVRRQSDKSNVYVKQAVQIASGGRGLIAVQKPDDVAQDDFDTAIRNAASEIIRAYEVWGGTAPDSVFELAGTMPPTERAIAMNDIYNKVSEAIYLADYAEEEFTYVVDMYYDDTNNQFFLLAIRNGDILKMDVSYRDGEIILGEFESIVIPESLTTRDNKLSVYRTKDGKKRWLQIASVATLNRVGEIDGTQLYDSFIAYATVTRQFPILNVYHLGPDSKIGEADFLAREGFVYIASGEFDDTPIADAVFETLANDTEGYWGNSIEFNSYESYIENFDLGGINLQSRVHTVGINTAISILPEKDAASLLTAYQRVDRGGNMNDKTKEALLKLFKDESLIEEFEELVGRANAVAANSISRSVESETVEEEVETEVEEVVEETEVEEVEELDDPETLVVELGENFVQELTASDEFRSILDALLAERLVAVEKRMTALETRTEEVRSQTEEVRDWVDDVPAAKTRRAVVSYRARNAEPTATEEKPVSFAEMAEETISSIFD